MFVQIQGHGKPGQFIFTNSVTPSQASIESKKYAVCASIACQTAYFFVVVKTQIKYTR